MQIQKLNNSSISQLISLCEAVGWLQPQLFMRNQFEMYLSIGSLFGYTQNEKLIATGGVFPSKSGFSSIGMLMVHPNFQKQGLGHSLLDFCVQQAPTSLPVILIATDAGVPLYQKYGFTTITTIHRFEKFVTNTSTNLSHLKQIIQDDLSSLSKLDKTATGTHRPNHYSILLARAALTFKIERNHRIESFSLCIQKGDVLCITPLIAKNEGDAIQLLQSICKGWNGTVRIDVPHSQCTFRAHLESKGFQETLLSPLMIKNGSHLSGNRDHLFAMMDAALC
ncbi:MULTISPECIES: GNAT family N-acetyltransferase [Bacillus]|uniref:GNAT family N-acetyltransferase n=1 Tax=Bacillus TaxID=1386 RepID=UPI0001A19297|nr:GNAT family N-acetyltransferase [Bacillus pseudomycoides]EEM15375.1 GCN5-related N-acetyltransferase [Bacillus pseudomycoides DSM 12442]MED1595269.1 GNAT family N-acetyltransferase [Bacillus pseudomycoides]MED4709423.1 GNAT family N-acetyltransferase [Bacillus pseudomycoides]OOR53706.1 N-acetyltransferase [Bacillus pseudomycoides]PDY12708.1 N-acetyltransferase [Bacillus pseudomycoides]